MDISILTILQWAIPVVLAITLHEAAHGYVARMFGDPTAHLAGRITLNPIKHIDPVGTLLVPGIIVATNAVTGAQFPPFGWAKPVPVDFGRLRNPKKNMLWVAAAGPGSNFVQAIAWALSIHLFVNLGVSPMDENLAAMAAKGVIVNIGLMLINLVPIPPLDGGRIAVSLLPHRAAYAYSKIEPYGFFILIGLLYFRVLDLILWPLMMPILRFISFITGA